MHNYKVTVNVKLTDILSYLKSCFEKTGLVLRICVLVLLLT